VWLYFGQPSNLGGKVASPLLGPIVPGVTWVQYARIPAPNRLGKKSIREEENEI